MVAWFPLCKRSERDSDRRPVQCGRRLSKSENTGRRDHWRQYGGLSTIGSNWITEGMSFVGSKTSSLYIILTDAVTPRHKHSWLTIGRLVQRTPFCPNFYHFPLLAHIWPCWGWILTFSVSLTPSCPSPFSSPNCILLTSVS